MVPGVPSGLIGTGTACEKHTVPVFSHLCINALVLFCVGNVFHDVPRLTVERGANLIDHAHGHFFD